MKTFLKNITLWSIGFISLFMVSRIAFFLYFTDEGFDNLLLCLFYGITLDISVSGYLMILYLILSLPYIVFGKKLFFKLSTAVFTILLGTVIITIFGNFIIYQNWNTLINNRAIEFLSNPITVSSSLNTSQIIVLIFSLSVLTYLLYFIYTKATKFIWIHNTKILRSYAFIVPLCVVAIRGGFQEIPVNESTAYYSNNIKLNHAAVNPTWHLINSVIKSGNLTSSDYVINEQEWVDFKHEYFMQSNKATEYIIDTSGTLNVIFILMESLSSGVTGICGGENITVFLDSLAKQNVAFTQAYSSGFRTDQGLASLFSGYPAQPNKSIIRSIDKTALLPNLANEFKNRGYNTLFVYGGDLSFSNMNAYLYQGGFESIIGGDEFPEYQKNNKWGAHDEFIFDRAIQEFNNTKEPFFSGILTLSNHEPFEVPYESRYSANTRSDKFKNTSSYADYCLKEFFRKAEKEKWYPNTLFIISADHGHTLPNESSFYDKSSWHIPIVWAGEKIKQVFKGKIISKAINQHDIASTLLNQLQWNENAFIFSRNVLDSSYRPFAYMCQDEYIGWIDDKSDYFVISLQENTLLHPWNVASEKSKNNSRLFVNSLLNDYIKR